MTKCPNCGHTFAERSITLCGRCDDPATKIYITDRTYPASLPGNPQGRIGTASYYRCDKHPLGSAHTVKVFTG